MTSLKLAHWQLEFVDRYLNAPKMKSLLVAPPGSGKTTIAFYAARQMLDLRKIDSVLLLVTRVATEGLWIEKAKSYEMNLLDISKYTLRDDNHYFMNSKAIEESNIEKTIDRIVGDKRWFLIVDDPGPKTEKIAAIVDRILQGNRESKALFIGRHELEPNSFDAEFRFDLELILDPKIIELPETEIRLARFSPSFAILRKLKIEIPQIDNLSWREFEMLIASLLERDGYQVELTRGTKDGGVDVVAIKDLGPAGYFKTIWQAKKQGVKNKVGISVVRELADTRQEFGASKGFIVTSSYLTKGALNRIERDNYILGKVDRDDLASWIKRNFLN